MLRRKAALDCSKLTPPDGANACHTSSKQQDFFAQSEHAGHGVSYNQCHAAHLVDELEGGES